MKTGICRRLHHCEEVILFDNGLRIESELRLLHNGRWSRRYVVCQRTCLSEAPLIGVFKNDSTRESGEYLDLSYLHNYVGYEWGFKLMGTNKTLAIIAKDSILMFSFKLVENMMFWKEWLKDVCGRSALFFLRIQSVPEDPSVLQLSSLEVRIHINRQALIIVQDVPPRQLLYAKLEDLFGVQCSEGQFTFRIFSPTPIQGRPLTFVFAGERLHSLNIRLQLLLRASQFEDYVKPADMVGFNVRSVSCITPPPPLAAVTKAPQSMRPTAGEPIINNECVGVERTEQQYANYGPQKTFLPSSVNPAVHSVRQTLSKTQSQELHPASNSVDSAEGAYAVPELEILQNLDGTVPATNFMNPSTLIPHRNSIHQDPAEEGTCPAPLGLVKPSWPMMNCRIVGQTPPPVGSVGNADSGLFCKFLSRRLRKNLSGSYSRYDGERVIQDEEADEANRSDVEGVRIGPPPPPPPLPLNEPKHFNDGNDSSRKGSWRSRITATLSSPLPKSNKVVRNTANTPISKGGRSKENLSASAHSHLNFRIDSAIAKGRERLKQSNRKSSNLSSSNTAASSSERSSIRLDTSLSPKVVRRRPAPLPQPSRHLMAVDVHQGGGVKEEVNGLDEVPSYASSISTLAVNANGKEGSSSCVTSIYDPATPLAASRAYVNGQEDLRSDNNEEGIESIGTDGGKEDGSELSLASSMSVCSEINTRVQFQRGGRVRTSGASAHSSGSRRIGSVSPTLLPRLAPAGRPLPLQQMRQSQTMLISLAPPSLGPLPVGRSKYGNGNAFETTMQAEYAELDGNNAVFSSMQKAAVHEKILPPTESRKKLSSLSSTGSFRFTTTGPQQEVDYVSICPINNPGISNPIVEKSDAIRYVPKSMDGGRTRVMRSSASSASLLSSGGRDIRR